MATKTNIIIGLLILTLVSTGAIYVEWKNDARIRVDSDKSTFYVPHEDYSWIWVVAGRELNKLMDGTSNMNRDVSNIKVETIYDENKITIKRTTPYIRGPVIIDTYKFDGKIDDINLFPISHTVEIINGTGYNYKYEVRDLVYDGETFKLDGAQTSQGFGRNMKVTWWEGYRLGWVYKSGSMYVKSEKLESDYEIFDVRLFDPVWKTYTFTLFLDGVNDSRKYEYYTAANITANVSSCTEEKCDFCIDIDDSINNVSYDFGNKNYSCGNSSVSFLYNITTLRQNEFNDSVIAINLTSSGIINITLDNRTDIDIFKFNITNYGGTDSENISIDVNDDGVADEFLLGSLSGSKLVMPYFYFDALKYYQINLSRTTAGTKTIYVNLSTSGFTDGNPVENFSFQIDGFDVDAGNDFSGGENFSNTSLFSGTYNSNISLFSAVDDFYDNDSSDWTVLTGSSTDMYIQTPFTSTANLVMQIPYFDSENPNDETKVFTESIVPFNMFNTSQFRTNLTAYMYATCFSGCPGNAGFGFYIHLSDGSTNLLLYSWSGSIDEYYGGTSTLDLNGFKTSDTNMDIYLGNDYSKTISLSSLDPDIKPYLKFTLTYTGGIIGRRIFQSNFKLYNLSMSGISLKQNESNYSWSHTPGDAVNYTSDSLNVTANNLIRTTLDALVYEPTDTQIAYYLSNDGATTWESVTNGLIHTFDSTGTDLRARFELNTTNDSISPIVYSYTADVTAASIEDVLVDIGADGTTDWNYSGILNSTTSPQYFRKNGSATTDYIDANCPNNATCYMPVTITYGTPGTLQISNSNLSVNSGFINITPSLAESFNPIDLNFSFTGGSLELSNLELDFLGSKNITFFAHWYNNTSFNDTHIMQVKYSKFNVSLPENISYWEVFPNSKDSKNVTPYGQTNTSAIWNITSQAYDEPFDTAIFVNESLNSCLEITFSNDSAIDNTTDILINTSMQWIYSNVSTEQNSGTFGIWNQVSLTNCSSRFYIPYFTFASICSECVKVNNWWNQVNTISE